MILDQVFSAVSHEFPRLRNVLFPALDMRPKFINREWQIEQAFYIEILTGTRVGLYSLSQERWNLKIRS